MPAIHKEDYDPALLAAVNSNLVTSVALAGEEKEMLEATLLWIQRSAWEIAKKNTWWTPEKWTDAENRKQQGFYTIWNKAIYAISRNNYIDSNNMDPNNIQNNPAWVDFRLGRFNFLTYTLSKRDDVGNILTSKAAEELQKYLGESAIEMMSNFSKILADYHNSKTEPVGSFFWKNKATGAASGRKSCEWTVSPTVRNKDGDIELAYFSIYLSDTKEDWRSLFIPDRYSQTTMQLSTTAIKLNLADWRRVKGKILDQLSTSFTNSVKDLDI